MGKGIPETFSEHEQDTARRAYEKEMFERARRTAKISKAEIEEALGGVAGNANSFAATESDSQVELERRRRVLSQMASDALDRDIRARMEELSPPIPMAAPGRISGLSPTAPQRVESDPEIDPHSRPTIDAFRPPPEIAALIETPSASPSERPPPPSDNGRLATAKMPVYRPTEGRGEDAPRAEPKNVTKPSRSREVLIPKWFITLAIVTVIMLIAAAGTVGFYLSHRLNRELPRPNL